MIRPSSSSSTHISTLRASLEDTLSALDELEAAGSSDIWVATWRVLVTLNYDNYIHTRRRSSKNSLRLPEQLLTFDRPGVPSEQFLKVFRSTLEDMRWEEARHGTLAGSYASALARDREEIAGDFAVAILRLLKEERPSDLIEAASYIARSSVGEQVSLRLRTTLAEILEEYRERLREGAERTHADYRSALYTADKRLSHLVEAIRVSCPPDRVKARVESELGDSYERLGEALARQGQAEKAEEAIRRGLAIWSRLVKAEPSDPAGYRGLGSSHSRLGDILLRQGRSEEAGEHLQESIKAWRRFLNFAPSGLAGLEDLATASARLGELFLQLGQAREAEQQLRDSFRTWQRLAAEEPTNTAAQIGLAASQERVGESLLRQGRAKEAEQQLRDSLRTWQRLAAEELANDVIQRGLASSHELLGRVLMDRGRLDEAQSHLEASVQLRERLAPWHRVQSDDRVTRETGTLRR